MHTKKSLLTIGRTGVPVYRANTVIIGAGAAGMGCAVHLCEFFSQAGVQDPGSRILVVTTGLPWGASRMSGSDKQTYYKMGTSPRVADTAVDFAKTLTAAGCMHGDLALIEAICSLRQFYHLVAAGVPFPHNPEGAFIGYKTDHDPYERATSAGPRTSRFMSECLQAKVERYGVPILDQHEVVEFLTTGTGAQRRLVGLVTLDKRRLASPTHGLTVFRAENFVLAAGGPGDLYQTTVYPRGQVGIHGVAFRAGLRAHNMTESQYGLASIKFRWNVSGTYMQVIPRIYSTAADGVSDEREFLTDYFPTMERLATCIFLKGYQWPFDAQRVENQQSSLVDLAVHRETVERGRRVFMDFRRNPVGAPGMHPFALARLEPEARTYLERTGARQALPIERLAHMNQPAIDIYTENGIDLWRAPLEIAVCAQHHNGGFIVDTWWQSTVPHTFVIGEMAGTHGVKRPGGAALNSGQVGAVRAAEYIANVYGAALPAAKLPAPLTAQVRTVQARLDRLAANHAPAATAPAAELAEIRARLTREAAHLRSRETIGQAVTDAVAQVRRLREHGLKIRRPAELPLAVQVESMGLTQVAFLAAIEDLIAQGAGSRGSHLVLDPAGRPMPEVLRQPDGTLPHWRPENPDLRQTVQEIEYSPKAARLFAFRKVPVRPIPERDLAFEPMWRAFREKQIFRMA